MVSRKVLMGTCGWSDYSLLRCGKFYPASVRTAEDRLRHYSTHFPCVEVDTSTYAIPSTTSIRGWLRCIPKGFLFHFKAFGLFCSKSCPMTALPMRVRTKVSELCAGKDYVHLDVLTNNLRDELWQIFNGSLDVAHKAGSLGVVLFQFHLTFKPTKENRAHVEWCRKNLDARFSMAAEFRCRDWFMGQNFLPTCHWLEKCRIALVAADELQHETFQKDRHQTGLPKGQEKTLLPVALAVTNQDFMYVRVHRREGTHRLLSDEELCSWENRLKLETSSKLEGPVYFMWGTDWEDQPIINAKSLAERLGDMSYNWKLEQRQTAVGKGLAAFFSAKKEEGTAVEPSFQVDEHVRDLQEEEKESFVEGGGLPERSTNEPRFDFSLAEHRGVPNVKRNDIESVLGVRGKLNKRGKGKAKSLKHVSGITSYFSK